MATAWPDALSVVVSLAVSGPGQTPPEPDQTKTAACEPLGPPGMAPSATIVEPETPTAIPTPVAPSATLGISLVVWVALVQPPGGSVNS